MTKTEAFRLIGGIDEKYVEAAENCTPRKLEQKKKVYLRVLASAAACLVLAAGIFAGGMRLAKGSNEIPLSGSSAGVTARYIDKAPGRSGDASLVWLDEDEIFTRWDTAIFRGTVTEVKNIEVDFNGAKRYQAIAKVMVSRAIRGPFGEDDVVPVLLPSTVGDGSWAEDCDIIETIRVGIEGIFMPIVYDDENNFFEMNGVTLDKRDLAPCGLADGMRWTFFETPHHLIYASSAYPTLAARAAKTLDEVEAFIWEKIK